MLSKRLIRLMVMELASSAVTGKGIKKIKRKFIKRLNLLKGYDNIIYKIMLMYNYFIDKNVPSNKKLLIGGVLLYFITPFDLIPDIIPFSGIIDDIIAIGYVWDVVNKEMESYAKRRKLTQKHQ